LARGAGLRKGVQEFEELQEFRSRANDRTRIVSWLMLGRSLFILPFQGSPHPELLELLELLSPLASNVVVNRYF
jgi:hypothetical protein